MNSNDLNREFLKHKDSAYRYAVSLLHNYAEAEDLVQDLYERLWRRRLLIRMVGFRQMVMSATRNMAIDRLRERQRRQVSEVEAEPLTHMGNMVELADSAAIVRELIRSLPEREREVIHLRDVEQMAYEDIAQMLGCAPSAARVAHSRARQKIKDEFTKIMNYGVQRP